MITKNIVQMGNPILFKKTSKEEFFDESFKKNIGNLVDTMRHNNVIGLSANQIGIDKSIFVTEIRKTKYRKNNTDRLRVFVNPKIVYYSDEKIVDYEGCGSVSHADFFAEVERSKSIVIEACDESGRKFQLEADGLLARVIQHEYDHLNGILFTEKIVDIKKAMSGNEREKRISPKKT